MIAYKFRQIFVTYQINMYLFICKEQMYLIKLVENEAEGPEQSTVSLNNSANRKSIPGKSFLNGKMQKIVTYVLG